MPTTLVLASLSAFNESSQNFQSCASQCDGVSDIMCINFCEEGIRQSRIQASATVPASTSASPTPSLSPYAPGGAVWQACTVRCAGTDVSLTSSTASSMKFEIASLIQVKQPSCMASCEVDYQNGAPNAVSVNPTPAVLIRSPAFKRDSAYKNSDNVPADA